MKKRIIKRIFQHMNHYWMIYAFLIFVSCITLISNYVYNKDCIKVSLVLTADKTYTFSMYAESIVEVKDEFQSDLESYIISFKTTREEAEHFYITDKVSLNFSAIRGKEVNTEIIQIHYSEDYAVVVVEYSSAEDLVGETVTLNATKITSPLISLPLSAIHQEKNRYYVYQVMKEKGPWGYEYTAYQKDVEILLRDHETAAISWNTVEYPVVSESEGMLFDGAKISFYN